MSPYHMCEGIRGRLSPHPSTQLSERLLAQFLILFWDDAELGVRLIVVGSRLRAR